MSAPVQPTVQVTIDVIDAMYILEKKAAFLTSATCALADPAARGLLSTIALEGLALWVQDFEAQLRELNSRTATS